MGTDLENVRQVFDTDKKEIIRTYGGTGGGVSKDDEGYHIVVFTDDQTIARRPGGIWKDIPVKIKYTGPISIH